MATTIETNTDLVQRVYAALNDQDRDAFAALCHDDLLLHSGDEDYEGLDAVIDYQWGTMFKAFPDIEFIVEDTIAEADLVAARLTITGTHTGEFQGIPPTHTEFEISGTHVTRIEDGNAVEVWLANDKLSLMQQLGVIEPPSK